MKTWSAWPNTSSVFALRAAPRHVRNPFAVEKMQVGAPSRAHPDGSIIYRSGLNPKNQRNFEVFTPCDFIAAITQHIPGKSFQLVRYYGWYSSRVVSRSGGTWPAREAQVRRFGPYLKVTGQAHGGSATEFR